MNHLKHAFTLMRQNKLFTAIYVLGTALAIATTTVFAVILYVRLAPFYPEVNRSRSGYIMSMLFQDGARMRQSSLSYNAVKEFIYPLESASKATAFRDGGTMSAAADMLSPTVPLQAKFVDPAFFDVYEFDFTDGKPFSEEDFEAGIAQAVITDNTAEKVFGTDRGLTGREIILDNKSYRIVGVVREPAAIVGLSYSQVMLPYTAKPGYDYEWQPMLGNFHSVVVADDLDAVREELDERLSRKNSVLEQGEFVLWGQPIPHNYFVLTANVQSDDFSVGSIVRKLALILLVLLVVPALNLSGLISSRMESRQGELGVRKSFGATRRALLSQVLWENLYLTLVGGALGLAITWLMLYGSAGWIFDVIAQNYYITEANGGNASLTPDVLFSPAIFGFAFLFCVMLNILSALVPAWHSLRHPIVKSLKEGE